MFLVSSQNTIRSTEIAARELSDREQATKERAEKERRNRLWAKAMDKAQAERRKWLGAKHERKLITRLPERVRAIVKDVAAKHNVSEMAIMSRSREHQIVAARNEVFYTLRCFKTGVFDWSYPVIGRMFDRDHTVVMHGVASHCHAHGIPPLSGYDIQRQREKKAHRARTRYLWDKAA